MIYLSFKCFEYLKYMYFNIINIIINDDIFSIIFFIIIIAVLIKSDIIKINKNYEVVRFWYLKKKKR